MIEQTIFDLLYPKYKIDKPIRLIELFSGYGSQALALKYLNVPFEHWKTCEWAVKSIQAYKDIHFYNDNNDYSATFDIDYIKEFLLKKGISSNYNEPMTKKQIDRMREQYARNVFNNIIATRNLVNISQVKGKDLEIKDTNKYCYIMTYSFPCQDLSLAGKGKGMSDTSTRSGLLWEVERILTELDEKPQVLLMENVPQVHSEDNKEDFKKWIIRLEELGYSNYWQDLIATDYGIPQTRNRCFMISILGNYSYSFSPKQELKLKLKDMLEDNVDEKYYLSEKTIEQIVHWKSYQNPLHSVLGEDSISPTITTRIAESQDGGINASMKVIGEGLKQTTCLLKNKGTEIARLTDNANTIMARDYKGFGNQEMNAVIQIKNANSKGYLEAEEGDGVDISARMKYHRGTVQKGKAQTLTRTGGVDIGVVVK